MINPSTHTASVNRFHGLVRRLVTCLLLAVATGPFARAVQSRYIVPEAPWPDDRGNHIQAHGGGVIRVGEEWFWFGEDRSQDNDPSLRYVACYGSVDLVNWSFRGKVLQLADPEKIGPSWILERPKVYFNRLTGKFVMYFHLDGPVAGEEGRYRLARVGVAVSDRIDGEYRYVKSFRPLGLESRDIGQFVDDDGSAYLIFESRPSKGFYIAKLSEDYLGVERQVAFVDAPLEGGAIVHYEGLYYMIGSALTGWKPNPNKFATARHLEGPWSGFGDIAPPATNTYGSQSTNLIKVVGSEKTTVIFLGDQWRPQQHWDGRYLWMPLEIGAGRLTLPRPEPWTIDVRTGVVGFAPSM